MILGLSWLLAFGVSVNFALHPGYDADEYIFANDARLIAQGALQGRDFFQYVMPGAFLVVGLAFKLAGPTLLIARVVQACFIAAASVAYAWLARRLGASRAVAALMAGLVLLITSNSQFGHRWFAQSALVFTLVAAWRALGREPPHAWGWVGIGAGTTYAMHQLDGAGLLVALALGLTWLAWREQWGIQRFAARAAALGVGWLIPLGGLALFYGLQGGLSELWWATHVWPLSQYAQAGNHNDVAYATDLGWLITPERWISRPYFYSLMARMVTCAFLPVIVTVAGLAWLVGVGRAPTGNVRRTSFLGLLVFVALLALCTTLRGRADVPHLSACATPHFLLTVAAIAAWEAAPREAASRGLRWLPRLALAGLVAAGVVCYIEVERHLIKQPFGWQSPSIVQAHPTMRALAAQLKPGDTVFSAAHGGMYNFYLAPNPTRYNYWVRPEDGYTLPSQFAEILRDVETKRPRFLLVPALSHGQADLIIKELLKTYTHHQTLPHVQPGWRGEWSLYVYRQKSQPQRSLATSGLMR